MKRPSDFLVELESSVLKPLVRVTKDVADGRLSYLHGIFFANKHTYFFLCSLRMILLVAADLLNVTEMETLGHLEETLVTIRVTDIAVEQHTEN